MNELANKIFNELFDDDDLNELENKKVISCRLGYKLSVIAVIECELDAHNSKQCL